jgi:tRNA-dihydrouridine synthase
MNAAMQEMDRLWAGREPVLALAPMQDITDLGFWRLISGFGGADVYFTEYFRVYPTSTLNRGMLAAIEANPTGRPIVAQLIGDDIPALVRSARELERYPIAGIDLNLGCPAPVVYRKRAGGGLLRNPDHIDAILGALRAAVTGRLSVKTRLGFDSAAGFEGLLRILGRHGLDWVTVHGRTVVEMYRSEVRYDAIAQAVVTLGCPVLANGNVSSVVRAGEVLALTGARGLMIGRGAVRNPWLFGQIRQALRGEPVKRPRGRDVFGYVQGLLEATDAPGFGEASHVRRVKKHLNYLGLGVEPTGAFLHEVRRVTTRGELLTLCMRHLDHEEPMALEPFAIPLGPSDVMAGSH